MWVHWIEVWNWLFGKVNNWVLTLSISNCVGSMVVSNSSRFSSHRFSSAVIFLEIRWSLSRVAWQSSDSTSTRSWSAVSFRADTLGWEDASSRLNFWEWWRINPNKSLNNSNKQMFRQFKSFEIGPQLAESKQRLHKNSPWKPCIDDVIYSHPRWDLPTHSHPWLPRYHPAIPSDQPWFDETLHTAWSLTVTLSASQPLCCIRDPSVGSYCWAHRGVLECDDCLVLGTVDCIGW